MYRPKLLLTGYGNIGKHIIDEFSKFDFVIYDKYQDKFANESVLEEFYDIAFVAVPTEMLPSGECDLSCINDIIGRIKADTIVVKSAFQ